MFKPTQYGLLHIAMETVAPTGQATNTQKFIITKTFRGNVLTRTQNERVDFYPEDGWR